MHIKRYLDLAQLNQRLSIDGIARKLGLPPADLVAFRDGHVLPGDEIMLMIGGMAGAPQELVLRDLEEWRARPRRSRRRLSPRPSRGPVALADGL